LRKKQKQQSQQQPPQEQQQQQSSQQEVNLSRVLISEAQIATLAEMVSILSQKIDNRTIKIQQLSSKKIDSYQNKKNDGRKKRRRRSNRVRARNDEKDMVIQLEVEEVQQVVGTSFTTEKEHDEFMKEYERRVKEKAQENSITDMKEADRRYGVEVVDEIYYKNICSSPKITGG
jgi:hypothetical protein